MFKSLFTWWKEDVLLKQALEESKLGLEKTAEMFSCAIKSTLENEKEGDKIRKMDREVNMFQVDVRRKILEHLAINPVQDITGSLVLITIIVDIERIGDYSKNIAVLPSISIFEQDDKFLNSAKTIGEELEKLFAETTSAFVSSDVNKAKKTLEKYTEINQKCNDMIHALTEATNLDAKKIVAYTLLFRYLKRVSSHLRNISTSVVNPFDRIGFKPI